MTILYCDHCDKLDEGHSVTRCQHCGLWLCSSCHTKTTCIGVKMILYYRLQIKKDGVWRNDETYSPAAVRQEEAHLLLGIMVLSDNERLIRIEESEAMDNSMGQILWIRVCPDGFWAGEVLSVSTEPPFFRKQ